MTAFIACYDLKETDPKPHGEFLKQAAKRGWSVWISTTDEFKRLPNTTLTGDFSDVNAAGEALTRLIHAGPESGLADIA